MAYCEWHQEIWSHYKTTDLMRLLNIPRYTALGIIGALSAWSIGNRPGGIIEKRRIETAVGWDKDPEELFKALKEAGWIDEVDAETVEIHDWEKVTSGFRKARRDAARKRKDRASHAKAAKKPSKDAKKTSSASPKTVRGRSSDKPVRGLSKDRRAEQNRTERTEQNRPNKSAHPRSLDRQQPQETPISGSSGGEKAPEGDAGGLVVAVPDGKSPEIQAERLKKQVSSRLATPILEALGMDAQVATGLAGAHPAIRILHVAEHAKRQDNPGGFARTALEQGWTVPDSNGAGLRNLTSALEAEIAAKDERWSRMGGGMTRRAPDFPKRQDGESEEAHTARVNEWLKTKKPGGEK